ncbi:MAG: hypothetical protein IPK76_20735 [Lewinellaceae bacterium]|jgi:hypothetical protein|nr:hypothetical protein [Lewinellaceae bacterium]
MQKPLILALLVSLMAFGCSKSDDNLKTTNWIVSYYQIGADQKDDTALFNNYSFELNDNNEWIIHFPDGSSATGKWAVDANTSIATFAIQNPVALANNIIGDWTIIEQSDVTLKLTGRLSTDPLVSSQSLLYFEKQ